MTRGFRFFAKRSFACIAAFLLFFCIGGCRKRANTKNANANSLTTASNPDEAKRNAQALVDQAKELYKNDEVEKAVKVLEQAIKLDPANAEGHLRLGMSYAALDRKPESDDEYKKAIELFKKKVEADPKDGSAFFYLGEAYNFLHRDEDAARNYREATQLNEKDEEAWYQLGMSLIKLARYAEAVSAFQKAVELDANDYRATDGLQEAQDGVQRIREGKKHNEDMLKKQQANANANGNANSSRPMPKRTP